jgi:hypothetical protein
MLGGTVVDYAYPADSYCLSGGGREKPMGNTLRG